MTALASIVAGSRITAAQIRGIAPLAAVKQADQSVTSSTTLVNDTALVVPVAAAAQYLFECYLDWEGANGGDLQWTWSLPGGATLRYASWSVNSGALVFTTRTGSDIPVATGQGAGSLLAVYMRGTLFTGSAAGSLQLRWAPNASNATPTIVHAQSMLSLVQTA